MLEQLAERKNYGIGLLVRMSLVAKEKNGKVGQLADEENQHADDALMKKRKSGEVGD